MSLFAFRVSIGISLHEDAWQMVFAILKIKGSIDDSIYAIAYACSQSILHRCTGLTATMEE